MSCPIFFLDCFITCNEFYEIKHKYYVSRKENMRYTWITKYTIHNKTILKWFIYQYFQTFYNLKLLNAYHRETSELIVISYLFE